MYQDFCAVADDMFETPPGQRIPPGLPLIPGAPLKAPPESSTVEASAPIATFAMVMAAGAYRNPQLPRTLDLNRVVQR